MGWEWQDTGQVASALETACPADWTSRLDEVAGQSVLRT